MPNDHFALTALSPLDGRYRPHLTEVRELFSEFSLIKNRLRVEVEYLLFLSHHTLIPTVTAAQHKLLRQILSDFNSAEAEKVKAWEAQTKHDVKAVEYYLRQKLSEIKSPLAALSHLALTSEDINSLSYSLILKECLDTLVIPRLQKILDQLCVMSQKYAKTPMLARTHGQPAVPTTVGKEIINFAIRLLQELQLIEALEIEAKLTGAVGNFNAQVAAFSNEGQRWIALSQEFVTSLGLKPQLFTTQILPAESYSQVFGSVVRINCILLDLNQDLWRYISDGYLVQELESGQVGSSTMPHKINPIDFENSEGNLGLANALLQHFITKLPVSRLQRDLSDSTVKRSFGTAFGYSELAYLSLSKGLSKVSVSSARLQHDLDQHWEVLTEAIQVVLRLHGDLKGYEKLQKLSQGKVVTQSILQNFIDTLELPPEVKAQLKQLRPETYVGLAPQLTAQGVKIITTYLQGVA